MPLAEDPMNDAHTRIAQARFEKELQDSEQNVEPSDDTAVFIGLVGVVIVCLLGVVLLLGTFISVIAFIFAVVFSRQRLHLIRDAALFAAATAIVILLIASASVIANLFSFADFFAYAEKVATFSGSEKKGLGAIALFAGRENRAELVFMNYQQTAIFLLALPLFISLCRNSNQLRAAWSGFNNFMNSFGGKYDYVREVAGIQTNSPRIIEGDASSKIARVDFGEVGYERQPDSPHDFDADDTDEKTKFRSVLNTAIKHHSPDLDPSKAWKVAEILDKEFGFNASAYSLEATDDFSDSQASPKMQNFMLRVCAALVKANSERVASKAG